MPFNKRKIARTQPMDLCAFEATRAALTSTMVIKIQQLYGATTDFDPSKTHINIRKRDS